MSELQLDARRRGLEQYLEKVCAVRVIAESDIMQEFLADRLEEDGDQGPAVDLKVLLPDREVVTVTVAKAASVSDVYDAVCSRVGLDAETAKYFYLFEIVEYNFGTYTFNDNIVLNIYIYISLSFPQLYYSLKKKRKIYIYVCVHIHSLCRKETATP